MKPIVHPVLDTCVAMEICRREKAVRVGLKVLWEWIVGYTEVEMCVVSVCNTYAKDKRAMLQRLS